MLFRRRQPETLSQRLRGALWPRRSWRRSLLYMKKRVLRLRASPHAIAAGIAAGVFATFTPLLGFHFVMACVIAYLLRGSLPAAVLGCLIGNPVTYPIIWGATYEAGRFLLAAEIPDGQAPESLSAALAHGHLAAIWDPYLKPMLIGSIPLGIVFAVIAYGLVLVGVRGFQAARAHKAASPAAEPVP